MWTLYKEMVISSAHHLPDSESLTTKKCKEVHGHNYKICVKIQRYNLKDGMVIDFGKVKDIVNELDHKDLNLFMDNPTAENVAKYIYDKIAVLFNDNSVNATIDVWETPTSLVTYTI